MPTKYRPPAKTGFTIYKITGCKYCDMALKHLAKAKNVTIINCDKYIQGLRNHDEFFKYMRTYTIIPYQYFPMIFYNGKFIGGYSDLVKVKKLVIPLAKPPAKSSDKPPNKNKNNLQDKHKVKPQDKHKHRHKHKAKPKSIMLNIMSIVIRNHKNNVIKQGS